MSPESNSANVHNTMGISFVNARQWKDAIVSFEQALESKPNDPHILFNLATALKSDGQVDAAIEQYGRVIHINPQSVDAFCGIGQILQRAGRIVEAIEYFRKAIEIKPDCAEAMVSLGISFQQLGQTSSALDWYQKAESALPALVAQNRISLYLSRRRFTEAFATARRALSMETIDPAFHSYLLWVLQHDICSDRETLENEHRHWGRRHARFIPPRTEGYNNSKEVSRRIRIGYVSPDFRQHGVTAFLEPLLRNHDQGAFEVTCYSHAPRIDENTQRLRQYADRWRDIAGISDDKASAQIEADQIDILVDVCGHMRGNRLSIFARKPAPIQSSYFTYACTTGLDQIDYRITDSWQDPPGSDIYYSEKLIRIDPLCWSYRPFAEIPIPSLPMLSANHITFGTLNSPIKINENVVALWARILLAIPNSRLMLRSFETKTWENEIKKEFQTHGICAERLKLVPRLGLLDYLKTLANIDVALDPFPYNGHTTSCDTLWMGVPIVTLEGNLAVGRVGASILSNINLSHLVAKTTDDYVQITAAVANDTHYLVELRSTLRERMKNSRLTDHQTTMGQLEQAYRNIWSNWCLH